MFFVYLVLNDYYTIFFSQLQLSIDNLLYLLIYYLSGHFRSCEFLMNGALVMIKTTIRLNTTQDIRDFLSAVSKQDYNVELVSGDSSIDAKSVMGLFSFDRSAPIELCAHTQDASEFFGLIGKFIVC